LIITACLSLETDRKKHIVSANKPAALRTPVQHKFAQKEVAGAQANPDEAAAGAAAKNDGHC